MNKRLLLVVALLAIFLLTAAAECGEIRGRVFLDRNANARCDPDEQGLPNCLVSDGKTLSRTDAQGRYRLESPAGSVTVFVVNQPGTWPSGPWWVTREMAAEPLDVDFALAEQKQSEPLYFVQGTDLHVKPGVEESLDRYISQVNGLPLPLQFVVHTGDLVVDALPLAPEAAGKLYDFYMQGAARIKAPLRHVIGNHEHVGIARTDGAAKLPGGGLGMYRDRLGPTSYAFRFGPYHFVALDGSTIDPKAKNGYVDRLQDASVDWSVAYLKTLEPNEPVVLMVHQPFGKHEGEQRLLEALKGKRLVLSICGHGHGRQVTPFGDAPSVMGGAVSYAWHGYMPFPPDPWGYVVYRLEAATAEWTFMNWAAERSFDLTEPAWGKMAAGRQKIVGAVTDFDGRVRRVTCRLGGQAAAAALSRTGHLATQFSAELDCSSLADGVYDLTLVADDGAQRVEHSRPLIVKSGRASAAAGAAQLRMKLSGGKGDCEVLLNEKPLATVPLGQKEPNRTLPIPPERLMRLCEVTFRMPSASPGQLSQVGIEIDGRRHCDVRFPAARAWPEKKLASPSRTYCIDVTYDGPRGLFVAAAPVSKAGGK